jgi:hypothetical protein
LFFIVANTLVEVKFVLHQVDQDYGFGFVVLDDDIVEVITVQDVRFTQWSFHKFAFKIRSPYISIARVKRGNNFLIAVF